MKEYVMITIGAIAIYFLFYLLIQLMSLECKIKSEKQGLKWDYGLIQGCMIKQNNKWIDYNRLRVIE